MKTPASILTRRRRALLAVTLAGVLLPGALAQQITVPGDNTTLSAAVNAATTGTTIVIGSAVPQLTGQISIDFNTKNNLTFRAADGAAPVSIVANNNSRIFNITQGGSFTFLDLILQGTGTTTSSGSAITINGSSGTATTTLAGGFTIQGFTVTGGQGAINAPSGNLSLGSSGLTVTLKDNTSTGGGAAIRGVNVTVEGNSSFQGNTAQTNSGGAIYVSGNLTFNGAASFQGNQARGDTNAAGFYGGAIHANTAGSSVSFLGDASFVENTTTHGNGGAIRANGSLSFGGNVTAIGNTASRNTTTNASLSVNGGAFYAVSGLTLTGAINAQNNSAVTNGGAIHVNAGNATFGANANFSGNSAQLNNGGAVNIAAGNVTFGSGASFANNSAGNSGGAINASGTAFFDSGASFVNNTATANNGGAVNVTGTLYFNGSADFSGNSAGNNGGALYTQGNLTLGPGSFVNNTAGTSGGAIYFGTSATASESTTLRLEANAGDITFQGNTAASAPNAIHLAQGLPGNATLTQILTLVTGSGRTIAFHDPVTSKSDADANALAIVEKYGDGTVLFANHTSNLHANTTVYEGTLALSGNATYGAASTVGSLAVSAGAGLEGHGTFRAGDISVASGARLRVTDAGTLTLDASSRTLGSALQLGGNGTLAAGSALQAASIAADAGGTLTLTDATTLAANGTLAGGATASTLAASAPIQLSGNTTLQAGTGHLTVAADLQGTGHTLTKTGSGTVTLAGTNAYGDTVISAGTLAVSSLAALGSGAITNQGTLAANLAADGTIATAITGSGNVTKSGTGALTLSGANSYAGTTTVEGGTLRLGSASAATGLASSSGVSLAAGATLDLNSHNTTIAALSGAGGTVALGSADLSINSTANATYGGSFSGAAGSSVTKAGAGTLNLSGSAPLAAGFAGDVAVTDGTLNVTGGALVTSGDFSLAAGTTLGLAAGTAAIESNTASLANGAAINIVGYSASALGAVDLITSGSAIVTDVAQLGLFFEGQAVGAPSLDQYLSLQLQTAAAGTKLQLFSGLAWQATASAHGTFAISSGSSFTTPAALADNTAFTTSLGGWDGTALTKTGAGTLTLGHVNSYTGATAVQAGTLAFGAADAIATSSAVTVAAGASLDLAGYSQTLRNLTGAGDITLGSATLTANTTANGTYAGALSGTGALVKQGTGTLTLSGANTHSGGTTVSAGRLVAQAPAALGTGPVVNTATLELAVSANATSAQAFSGSGELVKSGAGTLTLTAASGAAGTLTVSGGGLTLGTEGQTHTFTAGSASVAAGAALTVGPDSRLNVTNALALANNSTVNLILGASGPHIAAGSASIGATGTTLNLAGISGNTAIPFTLISTTGGITGDFATINVGGSSGGTDYLQVTATKVGNDYVLNSSLSWGSNPTSSGTFNLATAGESFTIAVPLANQAPNAGTNWDGISLTKTGAGTLTLAAANTYTGTTAVQGGTLAFGAANAIPTSSAVTLAAGSTLDLAGFNQSLQQVSGAGNIALGSATLTANQGANATLSGAISGTGALVKQGAGTLTLSGANTYSGGTTVSAGRVVATSGSALGTGPVANTAALEFALTGNGTFAGALTGNGTLTKSGAGTLNLTANSAAFTGATTVQTGALAVNGSLGGPLTVASGARLMGTGTVGSTTIASGARLAPGNSIGTLHVAGNLTFASGSTYDVEIAPDGTGDRTIVSGSATIQSNVTVDVTKAPGTYTYGTRYTILTANGGITGDFAQITQNLPFLDLLFDRDANNYYVDVRRNTIAFDTYARTPNEQAAARAIQDLGPDNDLYTAIVALPDEPTVRDAYNHLSGEIHAALPAAIFAVARHVREQPLARGQPFDSERYGHRTWSAAVGGTGRNDATANTAEATHRTYGMMAGRDFALGHNFDAGLTVGYTQTKLETDARASTADFHGVHLGTYASTRAGAFTLRGGAAATRLTIESERTGRIGPATQSLDARRRGTLYQAFAEAGYHIRTKHGGFEPYVSGAAMSLDLEAFRELGSFALHGRALDRSQRTGGAGVRGQFDFAGAANGSLSGVIGWQRHFGSLESTQDLAFINGGNFRVQGAPLPRSQLITDLHLGFDLGPNSRLSLGYTGRHASEASDHGLRTVLSFSF